MVGAAAAAAAVVAQGNSIASLLWSHCNSKLLHVLNPLPPANLPEAAEQSKEAQPLPFALRPPIGVEGLQCSGMHPGAYRNRKQAHAQVAPESER